MACCVLHNFLRGDSVEIALRLENHDPDDLPGLQVPVGNVTNAAAKRVRDSFAHYYYATHAAQEEADAHEADTDEQAEQEEADADEPAEQEEESED